MSVWDKFDAAEAALKEALASGDAGLILLAWVALNAEADQLAIDGVEPWIVADAQEVCRDWYYTVVEYTK